MSALDTPTATQIAELHDSVRRADVPGVTHCLKDGTWDTYPLLAFKDTADGNRCVLHWLGESASSLSWSGAATALDTIIKLLVDHGCPLELKGEPDWTTPLGQAVVGDRPQVVLALARAGASLDVTVSGRGRTLEEATQFYQWGDWEAMLAVLRALRAAPPPAPHTIVHTIAPNSKHNTPPEQRNDAIVHHDMKKTILFIRHGQSDANKSDTNDASVLDAVLTDVGRLQAGHWSDDLYAQLRSVEICYCSPLRRAMETAALVFQNNPGVPIVITRYAREKWWNLWQCRGVDHDELMTYSQSLMREIFDVEKLAAVDKYWNPTLETSTMVEGKRGFHL